MEKRTALGRREILTGAVSAGACGVSFYGSQRHTDEIKRLRAEIERLRNMLEQVGDIRPAPGQPD